MNLRPERSINKALISTTSRLVGEYETDGALITHAWPDFGDRSTFMRFSEGPTSRSAFVFAFQTEDIPLTSPRIPDYSPTGDLICGYLAVLFGKRFDNHGLVEGGGLFHVPNLVEFGQLCSPSLPHNSHKPRVDFQIPLNLTEVRRIEPLLSSGSIDRKFLQTFQTCIKFYLQALQNAERNPEVAYLHLITTSEILSNFYDYDKDELLDAESKNALVAIERDVTDGEAIARFISGKLLQVKKRFLTTLTNLVDESFFSRSESSQAIHSFKADSFMKCISSAYDLRSRYIHTGVPFGSWTSLSVSGTNNEVQVGKPVIKDDNELGKLIGHAPTFIGLERVVRYVLLRFAKQHGAYREY